MLDYFITFFIIKQKHHNLHSAGASEASVQPPLLQTQLEVILLCSIIAETLSRRPRSFFVLRRSTLRVPFLFPFQTEKVILRKLEAMNFEQSSSQSYWLFKICLDFQLVELMPFQFVDMKFRLAVADADRRGSSFNHCPIN